jgi:transcriptional regulator with XRE-family HTH domain
MEQLEIVERLKHDLQNEEARNIYADTVSNAVVAAQIKGLRERLGWSQGQLAEAVGTQQSGISRLERADYSAWKVETLRKLAKALGVRLRIRFEGFGTLVDEVATFNEEGLLPATFDKDPVLFPTKGVARRRGSAKRNKTKAHQRRSIRHTFDNAPRDSDVKFNCTTSDASTASVQNCDNNIDRLPSHKLPNIEVGYRSAREEDYAAGRAN